MRNHSIKRQVLVLALLTCAGVLLPVGVGLFFHHYQQTQTRLAESLHATARITAANVSAALAFRDQETATEILAALKNYPLITAAIIRNQQHVTFAVYTRENHAGGSPQYEVSAPIVHSGETYGQLFVSGDIPGELRRTALTWILVYIVAFIAAFIAALLIARRFQRLVALPLVELAATAVRVTNERDYQARAPLVGCAEVSALALALNSMLAEIARRDAELARQVEVLNHEIRERTNAEQALRENQNAMVRLSREAGMAEVAVGVLHNIGNVLTSINVSSDLLANRLAKTRRRPVTALQGVLTNPTAELVFAAHADGRDLRDVIANVATTLATDFDESTRMLGIMQTGIAHLKQIVTSQQSLARTSRLSESFVLSDVLRDAMILARTICRQLTSIKEFPSDRTQVYADRSMAVQILLNLLINAQESIVARAPETPSIQLAIARVQEKQLAVSITDNGLGISAEKFVSIFTYGYTTKPNGHGFGLHNSANAARLMGGSLTVTSPGLGHGATFTLTLPTHPLSPDLI
jgi:two-component system, NtrC family, sensor kinase